MIVHSKSVFYSNVSFLLTSEEKTSVKASNSLPEFFQEEFPTFQEFIDVYYSFMSKKTEGFKNISTIKDIDEIGKKYLESFYKMYAKDLPEFPYMGMADFVRNSKAFYVSIGSEESFRFMFRIMFGQEIDIKYPKENIFVPSSGKWNQKVTIYVQIENGTVTDELIGHKLLIRSLDGSTSSLLVNSFVDLGSNLYEIGVDNFIKQNVVSGASVFSLYDKTQGVYGLRGTIKTNLNLFDIINPGTGFFIGQVFSVSTPEGDVDFRITETDNQGGIKRIEFVKFAKETPNTQTYTVKTATIRFRPGTVNTYTGFYENVDGFLSNHSKLEDNYFYQIFSYVIKSRVSRELYIDLMEKILHPSGLISFSEFDLGSDYDVNLTSSIDFNTRLVPIDVLNTYDVFVRKFKAFRVFSDNLEITDTSSWLLKKFFNDVVNVIDSGNIKFTQAGQYVQKGYTNKELYTFHKKTNVIWNTEPYMKNGYVEDAYTIPLIKEW